MMQKPDWVIPFTKPCVLAHLDELITKWRRCRDNEDNSEEDKLKASCYVDAYQCVRNNLFGETLK